MGKNKKNRGGKGKGAKKKGGTKLPPSHYLNKQQNQKKSLYLDQIHDNMKGNLVKWLHNPWNIAQEVIFQK